MSELYTTKRVEFPQKEQKKFINKINTQLSIKEIAILCKCSERTIRDWRREKFLMRFKALQILCRKTHTPLPKNIKLQNRYWYAKRGGYIGGKAVYKKYGMIGGDPEYRKKKWYEWWEKEGKFKTSTIINTPIPIKNPRKSCELAEFVGIVLGDGGISKRQITITLHKRDDKEYGKFVASLIENLFHVPVSVRPHKKHAVNSYVVSRTELVRLCTNQLGLKQGNKVKLQVGIPSWIKSNKKFSIACVRGLMDTDGSIFTHRYQVNKKWYSYKKLSFTNCSKPILRFVFQIFNELDLHPRIARDRDVRIDSIEAMKNYFYLIDSHNPKHLKRYKN